MTLAEFLAARLDKDERNAREALAQWAETHFTIDPGSLVLVHFHREHDPARVLREVEAGRKLLARWHEQDGRRSDSAEDEARAWLLDALVADRAAVWSDHEDYRADMT